MKKALFLDRDGIINIEKNYVHKIEDFEFVDGVFETLRFFQNEGYLLIIITNQAGIGRGYYTEKDFHKLNEWMLDELMKQGIRIDKVYYDPYHPVHGIGKYKKDSVNRKPNPGMILDAKMYFDIDLEKSALIGDKLSDIEAGKRAGIKRLFLLNERIEISNDSILIRSIQELIEYA